MPNGDHGDYSMNDMRRAVAKADAEDEAWERLRRELGSSVSYTQSPRSVTIVSKLFPIRYSIDANNGFVYLGKSGGDRIIGQWMGREYRTHDGNSVLAMLAVAKSILRNEMRFLKTVDGGDLYDQLLGYFE